MLIKCSFQPNFDLNTQNSIWPYGPLPLFVASCEIQPSDLLPENVCLKISPLHLDPKYICAKSIKFIYCQQMVSIKSYF